MEVLVPSDVAGACARFAAFVAGLHWVLARRFDLAPAVLGLLGATALWGGGGDALGWALVAAGAGVLGLVRAARNTAARWALDAGALLLVGAAVGVGLSQGDAAWRAAHAVCAAVTLYGGLLGLDGRPRVVWSRTIPVEDGS